MTTTTGPTVDERAAEEFAERLFGLVTGGALTFMVDIGYRTGLFEALAESGPATSGEVAAAASLDERYVREWLGAMATAGIVELDPATHRYWLPREHAASLTGAGVVNLAPLAFFTTLLAKHVPAVADAFRHGGGVPYAAYLPELHDAMDALWKPVYDDLLVPEYLPLAPGLSALLAAGARVADVACGAGNSTMALAAAFPASTFVGYDSDASGVDRARAAAAQRGLPNVRFEVADAARLTVDEPFDAAFVFNAVHDQADPAAVLRRIRDALVPGGVLFLDEPRVSSDVADNVGNPMAPFLYAVSTLHCMTVSLAQGGAGLGTAWGEQVALRLLAEAGFERTSVFDAPGDPTNAVFVTYAPAVS